MVVEAEKLKDNLWVMKGGGGNSAVFLTADGVTVVDTKLPGWGKPLLDKIKTVTDKPVTRIINTHTHFDHVSGNVEFPATVEVVTHENTKMYMDQANPVYGLQTGPQTNLFKQNDGKGMPKRTFKDKMTIGSGADQIDLYYFGRAHTGGDAYVVFPALRLMHVGDTMPTRDMPIMDKNNGGSGVEFSATIAQGGGGQRRRHDHQRAQPDDDDAGRSEALLGVHRRLREVRPGRQEGRQDRGRRGERLEDAREVHRLRNAESGPRQGGRAGRLRRDEVAEPSERDARQRRSKAGRRKGGGRKSKASTPSRLPAFQPSDLPSGRSTDASVDARTSASSMVNGIGGRIFRTL